MAEDRTFNPDDGGSMPSALTIRGRSSHGKEHPAFNRKVAGSPICRPHQISDIISFMITVVTGMARSGTSLTMQMLQAAGFELYWDRMPNITEINPRGHFEFKDQQPIDHFREVAEEIVPKMEGKVVKMFPSIWAYLPPNHEYRFIYLDRDLVNIRDSQQKMMIHDTEMCGEDSSDNAFLADPEFHLSELVTWRDGSLDWLADKKYIKLWFGDLFTGAAQEQLGAWLGCTREQIDAMKDCVDPNLRHFYPHG